MKYKPEIEFQQPVLLCKRGHVIPANMDEEGRPYMDPQGAKVKNPHIACEICARAAGGTIRKTARRKKGDVVEEQAVMLEDAPSIFIS